MVNGTDKARHLRLAVTRSDGHRHSLTVVHDSGAVTRLPMADYGPALPHDLAHAVVESVFRLQFGFWGLIAEGASFAIVTRAAAGAPGVRRADPAVEAHLGDLLEAEALVNEFSTLETSGASDADFVTAIGERRADLEHGVVEGLTVDRVADARRALDALNRRWQATAVGDTLRLDFPIEWDDSHSPLGPR